MTSAKPRPSSVREELPDIRYRVLGLVRARGNGKMVTLGGPKQRAVLCLLIAAENHALSTEALIDGVWGEHPSHGARSTLHTYISNLKLVLGDVLIRDGGEYRLLIARSEVDAYRFEDMAVAASDLLEEAPEEAAALLSEALALWEGTPFAEVSDSAPLELEAERLQQLRLDAVEWRIDALLALGNHSRLIPELEALTAQHPFRERFRAQHMLALYRSGRQAEALRAYQKTGAVLAEELGIDPSPDLQELEERIIMQDPALLLDSGPRVERLAITLVQTVGLERTWTLPAGQAQLILEEADRLISNAIDEAGGHIFKRSGESTWAVFTRASSAVAASRRAQESLHSRIDRGFPRARIAIDVGEVEVQSGEYSGPPLSRSARITVSGHGGQILLTREAHSALAASESGWQAIALGEHRFEGLEEPQQMFQLVVEGLPAQFPPLDTAAPPLSTPGQERAVRGFELRERLGEGDLGIVYRGYQPAMGREVAVKVIRPELANQKAFLLRFEAEGQLVASLEHPQIVALYDYWRDPEAAYLVMRWLRGGSLRDSLETGPWEVEDAGALMSQVCSGLAFAHRRGVLHRNLKPSNVLLDEDWNAYLTDFAFNRRLFGHPNRGSSGTSPAYLTPEELRGESFEIASDIYGLGLLAFELLSGTHPPMDRAVPPLAALRPELAPAVDEVISKAISDIPGERFWSVDEFLNAWEIALDGRTSPLRRSQMRRNPYKGLRAFSETDSDDFYGRDHPVDELIEAIERHRMVAAVGPSGIGKSSAVRAGVIPALRGGQLPGSKEWLLTDMIPGFDPFEQLESALLRVAVRRPGNLPTELTRDEGGMLRVVRAALPPNTTVLLLIDQFEELFTLTSPAVRQRFIEGLTRLMIAEDTPVRVLVTLRADFFDRPLQHGRLGALLRDGLVTILPPNEDELRQAIEEPAKSVGISFEPGLVSRVISEVRQQPGMLPAVQYMLTELFESRTSDLLTIAEYEVLGGVAGALGRRAEQCYLALDSRKQDIARELFLHLVRIGPEGQTARRRFRTAELRGMHGSDDLTAVLDTFGKHRLLTFDRDPIARTPTVEVAHEALFTHWKRLSDWIEDHREDLVVYRRLTDTVEEWEENNWGADYLLTGGRLEQIEQWSSTPAITLTQAEKDFLAESRRSADEKNAVRRRRRTATVAVLLLAAVVSLLLAATAFQRQQQANQAERLATARELAASAIGVLDRDPELSILLALEAMELEAAPLESLRALRNALQRHRAIATYNYPGARTGSLSPDGAALAVVVEDDTIEVLEAAQGGMIWRRGVPIPEDSTLGIPAFTEDGRLLVAPVSYPDADEVSAGLYAWEATSGEPVIEIPARHCGELRLLTSGAAIPADQPFGVVSDTLTESGCDEGRATLWSLDLAKGTMEPMIQLPKDDVQQVYFAASDDLRYLAVSGLRTRVVDTSNGEDVFTIDLEEELVRLSSDGRLLVAGGEVGSPLRLFDVQSGVEIGQLPHESLGDIAFGPEDSILISSGFDGIVRVWELESGRQVMELVGHQAMVDRAVISQDGSRLASFSIDGSVKVWNLGPLGELGSFDLIADARTIIPSSKAFFASDGLNVSGGQGSAYIVTEDDTGMVVLFDPDTGEPIHILENVAGQLQALSPDGRLIAAQEDLGDNAFGTVRVFDSRSGETVLSMHGLCVNSEVQPNPECRTPPQTPFAEWVWSMDYSSDGALLASGGESASASAWDTATGEMVFNSGTLAFGPEGPGPPTVAFNPDGSRLVASSGSTLHVWETDTWSQVARVPMSTGWFRHLRFSPTGTLVGSADRSAVVIIDPATWDTQLPPLVGHEGLIKDLEVSPDGALIVSAGSDGLINVWDSGAGELVQVIPMEDTSVQNVAFIDDRHLLVTGMDDPALIFTLDTNELIDITRQRVTRGLTAQECRTYLHLETCPSP